MKNIQFFYEKNNFKHFSRESMIDIILIGGGIMTATLSILLTFLEPNWKIHIYERLKKTGQESSNGWNNAGTGHAAFCELNYTPQNPDGSIDISKAIKINEAFLISCQFWAYLVKNKILNNPKSFINNVPHMSFVWGKNNVSFLKKRFQTLQKSILFHKMTYTDDPEEIYQWAPLIISGRNKLQKVAATRMNEGTDIDFGEITRQLFLELNKYKNINIYLQHDVLNIKKNNDNTWYVNIIDYYQNTKKTIHTNYIFIGSGGKSLNLLQTSKIDEISGYAGFPVGGQFLITRNKNIIKQHSAKIYGKTTLNAPPMSTPHIDTRILNNKKFLLFGPFATFSSKFLKYGSQLDFLYSLNKKNILPILQVGLDNFSLIKYLINQLIMSKKKRIQELKKYYPKAKPEDWTLLQAGQRVQIIKKNYKNKRGTLQFGTEIIYSKEKTLSAILGASPGASTSVSIILELLTNMFSTKINSNLWKRKIKEIIPSYLNNLNDDIVLMKSIQNYSYKILELTNFEI